MAMMDDPAFLVSHIRNSFITSDDTGMCELIIDADERPERGAAADRWSTPGTSCAKKCCTALRSRG